MDVVDAVLDSVPGVLALLLLTVTATVLGVWLLFVVAAALVRLTGRHVLGLGDYRPGRAAVLRAAGVCGAAAALAAAIFAATGPTRDVPLPPLQASPQDVLRAYLDASTYHDVETMNALCDDVRLLDGERGTHSRFDATEVAKGVLIHEPVAYHELDAELPAGGAAVQVTADLTVRIDGTEDRLPMVYYLARLDDHHRWVVIEGNDKPPV